MIGQRADSMRIGLSPAQLRPEELLVQTADALERLETVANTVFARLEANCPPVPNLRRRAATCHQATIDSLKGTTKAVQVFAAPKYPVAAGADAEFQSPQREALNEAALMEMRHFMQRPPVDLLLAEEEEGLGRLPNGLTSLSSLLLFNTTAENPNISGTPLLTLSRAHAEPGADQMTTMQPRHRRRRRRSARLHQSWRPARHRPDGGSLLYMPSLGRCARSRQPALHAASRREGVAENVRPTSGDLGRGHRH
uniref:WASH_WAHD domain-containing protein n=1 Tax=Macrostomum lignano TaxID=282301 RepID=A0A1I8G2L0_9PLAT